MKIKYMVYDLPRYFYHTHIQEVECVIFFIPLSYNSD